jgi:hypothetical protein
MAVRCSAEASLVSVTEAPGITRLVESATAPATRLDPVCAGAETVSNSAIAIMEHRIYCMVLYHPFTQNCDVAHRGIRLMVIAKDIIRVPEGCQALALKKLGFYANGLGRPIASNGCPFLLASRPPSRRSLIACGGTSA